jgi:hypothetical protein
MSVDLSSCDVVVIFVDSVLYLYVVVRQLMYLYSAIRASTITVPQARDCSEESAQVSR